MDFVYYKLPHSNEIQFEKGEFSLLDELDSRTSGFIVTDFLHRRKYLLKEDKNVKETLFHFKESKPYAISQRDYLIEAQSAIHAFGLMGVQKMVYSRVKMIEFDHEKTVSTFESLSQAYPSAFCYLISSKHFGTWIGATPEVLTKKRGLQFNTVALASTKKNDDDSEWNSKDFDEHRFVVESIKETAERYQIEELEIEGPYSHQAGPVRHLKTDFSGVFSKENHWEFVNDLHPTPAVCGTPRIPALDLLLSREMHDRELYTGYIGVVDSLNLDLFVNLRCAQIQKGKAFLYVGGGFTKDSIAQNEWEETENKAETLLKWMR
jgi:isochorismate synthase